MIPFRSAIGLPPVLYANLPVLGASDAGAMLLCTDMENNPASPLVGPVPLVWEGDRWTPMKWVTGDPRGGSNLFVDFFNGVTGVPTGSAVSGSGATVSLVNDAVQPRPGGIGLATGTTATGRAAVRTSVDAMVFNNADMFAAFGRVKLPVLSNATDRFAVRVGLIDTDTGASVDGAYIEYDEVTSANWRTVTANNSARTANNSALVVTANQFYRFKIVCKPNAGAANVLFYLNNALLFTHTANIPVTSTRAFGMGAQINKSVGTASRIFQVDYLMFHQRLASSNFDL